MSTIIFCQITEIKPFSQAQPCQTTHSFWVHDMILFSIPVPPLPNWGFTHTGPTGILKRFQWLWYQTRHNLHSLRNAVRRINWQSFSLYSAGLRYDSPGLSWWWKFEADEADHELWAGLMTYLWIADSSSLNCWALGSISQDPQFNF